MSKNELEKLKELALRGLLDDEKERRLRMYIETDPSCAIPDIDKEILLGKLLRNLPKAPVSSNFTARVMSEIERLETEPVIPIARPTVLDWLLERLVYKVAAFAVVLVLLGFCYFSYTASKNAKLANKISELSRIALLEDKEPKIAVEIFKDFDVIQNLNQQSAFVDTELLAALKAN
jgi:hypothetical protein